MFILRLVVALELDIDPVLDHDMILTFGPNGMAPF